MNDWRLQGQEKFLNRAQLVKKRYKKYRDDWDHDHCAFCWTKFSESPEDLNVGYTTPDHYYWICEPCFNDFHDMFQWVVSPESGD